MIFITNVDQLSISTSKKSFYEMSIDELCALHYEVMVLNRWPVCFGKKPLFWDTYNIPAITRLIDMYANHTYRKALGIIRERIGWLEACRWEYREVDELTGAELENEALKDLTNAEHRQPYCQQIPRMSIYQNIVEAIQAGRYTEAAYRRFEKRERKARVWRRTVFFILDFAPILTLIFALAAAAVACVAFVVTLLRIL